MLVHNNAYYYSNFMLNQRLVGTVIYADGLPFSGTLRLRRSDGNALQEMFRSIPIVDGIIPDYVRLYPGVYEVQWLPSTPDGLLPSEEWLITEFNEIKIADLRDRYSVPTLLAQKDAIIVKLQERIKELENDPKKVNQSFQDRAEEAELKVVQLTKQVEELTQDLENSKDALLARLKTQQEDLKEKTELLEHVQEVNSDEAKLESEVARITNRRKPKSV